MTGRRWMAVHYAHPAKLNSTLKGFNLTEMRYYMFCPHVQKLHVGNLDGDNIPDFWCQGASYSLTSLNDRVYYGTAFRNNYVAPEDYASRFGRYITDEHDSSWW
ncbi:unnamed protein product [Clavelina lepadiformis]|uniref:Uncharacterized protein n=1 Tax=Clavelina lepadiformis TaxID=159417 RepID=A0ABP0FHN7_CLALP